MRSGWVFIAVSACVIGGAYLLRPRSIGDGRSSTSVVPLLPQDVYVWQRAWTSAVREAVSAEKGRFRRFVVLAAEISLQGGEARVTEIDPDYERIAKSIRQIGIAIRIGPLPATGGAAMDAGSKQTALICTAAAKAAARAREAGIEVTEVQIDFDCAESKLAGYANWVRAVRQAVSPIPVIITALPTWLKRGEFINLAHEAGGYVLQVHSLHKPASPDAAMTLCDPDEAQRAVIQAAKIGVPFRVALPTYSYLAGFSPDGDLLGLSAEGPAPSWPTGTTLRVMRSDPASLAALVWKWSVRRPPEMIGIIWYRLPVAGDTMNWPAQTLRAVMAGLEPKPDVRAEVIRTKPGLLDVYLRNEGDADGPLQCEVTTTWDSADLVAVEGIGGFERLDASDNRVTFRAANVPVGRWIAPGERIQIGWLRLSTDKEVRTHVSPLAP